MDKAYLSITSGRQISGEMKTNVKQLCTLSVQYLNESQDGLPVD